LSIRLALRLERSLIEEKLSFQQKRAEKLFRKEKKRAVELKRLNALMDTFVYAAAHDLKGPVSNIKLLTSLIQNADTNDRNELQNKYSPIVENLDRTLSGLISILEMEKEFGDKNKNLNLSEVYDHVIKEMNPEINEIKPDLSADFSRCKTIWFNEAFLTSIFRNIIRNALKYRSEERRLSVQVNSKHVDKYIQITFRDNGSGIDLKRFRKYIYKPFWSYKSKSTGIGLFLVKTMVTRNGGKIEVKSTVGKGTTFKVYIVPYK